MSSFLSLVVVPLFSFVPIQEPAAPAPAPVAPAAPTGSPEAKAALVKAIDALAAAGSYAFELKTEGSGGGFGGRRNRGGEGESNEPQTPPPPAKIQYEKGLPLHLTRGEMQAFVQGDVIVYLDTEKQTWEKFDPASMRGGRGGRGPGGGEGGAGAGVGGEGNASGGAPTTPPATPPATPETPPAPPTGGAGGEATPPAGGAAAGEGGDRRGGGRGNLGRMRDLLGVARAQPPHLVLGDLATSVDGVTQSEVDGKVVMKGTLSKDAAEKIASAGFTGGRGGFGGGDGPERESSGSFEATLDAQGHLVSLVVDTKIKMSFGERDFERTSKHSYLLADVGAVSVDVPEEALVHFEF